MSWTLRADVVPAGQLTTIQRRTTCTGTKKEALQQLGLLVSMCERKTRKKRVQAPVAKQTTNGDPPRRTRQGTRQDVALTPEAEPASKRGTKTAKQTRTKQPQKEVLPPIKPQNFLSINAAFGRLYSKLRTVAAEKDAECRVQLKEKDKVIGSLQANNRQLQKAVARLSTKDPMPYGAVADRSLTAGGCVSGRGRPVALTAATKDAMEEANLEPYGSRTTFYNHLQTFINSTVSDRVKGNVTRAKSLAIGLANHLNVGRSITASEDEALGDGLLKMLQLVLSGDDNGSTTASGQSKGRCSNFQRIIGDCIDDVCALALEETPSLNAAKLGRRLGRNPRLIRLASHRLKAARQTMQMRESLIRFRGKVRSDKLQPEWELFAKDFWIHGKTPDGEEVSRESEISNRCMRNPHNLSDKTPYRHRYLVVTVGQEHEAMLHAARQEARTDPKFVGFHLSQTRNSELRPFWVKDACRQTCLCIYHLQFMDATKELYTYLRLKRASKQCSCTYPLFQDSPDLWHYLLCAKPEGDRVYARDCINNTCSTCASAKRLETYICSCCKPDDNIQWSKYQDVPTGKTRETDDGKEEAITRKQFVDQGLNGLGTPLSEFLHYFRGSLYPEFVAHHDLATWQVRPKLCVDITDSQTCKCVY